MRNGAFLAITILCFGIFACGGFFLSEKGKLYYQEAAGPTGLETAINLASMMVLDISQNTSEPQETMSTLANLDDQFEALKLAFKNMTDEQRLLIEYKQAVTLHQELNHMFKRLQKYRKDHELRRFHLEMVLERMNQLRVVLHSMLIYTEVNSS